MTNFRSGVERTTVHCGGDDGSEGYQNSSKAGDKEFSSSLSQEQGCKALQQGCRSGAEAQAAASKFRGSQQLYLKRSPGRSGALSSVPSPSRRSRRPCCLFQPLGGHRAKSSASAFFFFTSAGMPADPLFVHPNQAQVPLSSRPRRRRAGAARCPRVPSPHHARDSFFGSPSQKPTLVRLAP